jgi:TPR repeat protein
MRWYRLAAEQGDADAQYIVGVMYHNGEGVPQDYIVAHMWWNLSATKGNELARQNRDVVARDMTPDQIAEAQRLAREWKPTK